MPGNSLMRSKQFPDLFQLRRRELSESARKHWAICWVIFLLDDIKTRKFPVFFPVNGNLRLEKGSRQTASTRHLVSTFLLL
jgi:hypothetical protein